MNVPTMAEMMAQGKQPEVLFWVGCAGSFDDRAKKITKAFVKILHKAKVDFAVLGTEESCTGDPAKRAGNEFLFQMQAMTNIEVMNAYEVKKPSNFFSQSIIVMAIRRIAWPSAKMRYCSTRLLKLFSSSSLR